MEKVGPHEKSYILLPIIFLSLKKSDLFIIIP